VKFSQSGLWGKGFTRIRSSKKRFETSIQQLRFFFLWEKIEPSFKNSFLENQKGTKTMGEDLQKMRLKSADAWVSASGCG